MPSIENLFGVASRIDIPLALSSEESLLQHLGISARELKKIWWYRNRMYHHFNIAKGKGKSRQINAPDKRLKFIQGQIAELLDQIYHPRNPVHGFVSQRSVKTNAFSHVKGKYVVNIDIKEFFPTIEERRIRGMLIALGINERVSEIITRICCNNGHLPQGSPSSPVLSNMICFRLDKLLLKVAKRSRCIYTRYADDITFSSFQPPTPLFEGALPPSGTFAAENLSARVRSVFDLNGFILHPEKLHYADRYSRRIVTGLKINQGINVDRRFVRNVRALLFQIEKLGTEGAQKMLKEKYDNNSGLEAHLRGKISWLGHIKGSADPVFRRTAQRFNQIFKGRPIKIEPSEAEKIERSVWVVEHFIGEMFQGTAFYLKDVGLVTAAHCVEGATEVDIYHPTKSANKFKATIEKICKHRDLAILKHDVPESEYFYLERSTLHPQVGDQVVAVGYPSFGPGDKLNLRPGLVTSLPIKSAVQLIEVSQKLAKGMSGGPILNEAKKVIGVVHKGGPTEERDLAVHIQVLNDWIT